MESLICAGIVLFCLWLYRNARKTYGEAKRRTLLDAHQEVTTQLFREICPVSLTRLTDDELLAVARASMCAFQQAAMRKGERIPGKYLVTIACYFLMVYATSSRDFFVSHLQYEVDRYSLLGLRDTYKRTLF